MGAIDKKTLAAANSYTKKSIEGVGAVAGKNVIISSIDPIPGGNRITFSYTLDDGTPKTSTLDVMDGKDGEPGADGADGISITGIEKTGTSGLIDTYTISFSDGSTFDYEIKNGKDGNDGEYHISSDYTELENDVDFTAPQDGYVIVVAGLSSMANSQGVVLRIDGYDIIGIYGGSNYRRLALMVKKGMVLKLILVGHTDKGEASYIPINKKDD